MWPNYRPDIKIRYNVHMYLKSKCFSIIEWCNVGVLFSLYNNNYNFNIYFNY